MTILTSEQVKLKANIYSAWNDGARNVMPVAAVGTGKTVTMASLADEHDGYGCSIAHRASLVGQISLAYAAEQIPHRIIAPPNIVNQIRNLHLGKFGRQFINPVAPWAVASVDTLINRDANDPFFKQATLINTDEGHHVLKANKWGRAMLMFTHPNVRGLLWTASPDRADGKGLGRKWDGLADVMVESLTMRQAIEQGYLTDYQVFCPTPADLNLDDVPIGATGDYNMIALQKAMAKSTTIVGDVVGTYLRRARGRLGLTFAVGIEEAEKLTRAFNAAGVPAAMLTADTPAEQRASVIAKFERRELWQIVSVDLIGEGFDMPAIECISFARPTASFPLYLQMWGRALRVLMTAAIREVWGSLNMAQRLEYIRTSLKPYAMIFDHVGNMLRHRGPPDKARSWTLERRARRTNGGAGAIPLTICAACEQPFERIYTHCPYCGQPLPEPEPGVRVGPEMVDGDLYRVDPYFLEQMRQEVAKVDGRAFAPNHLTGYARDAVFKNHNNRQAAQHYLREAIGYWATLNSGYDDRTNYRRFYHLFGVDVLSAKAMGASEADALRKTIVDNLAASGHRY